MDRVKLLTLLWQGGMFTDANLKFFPQGNYKVISSGMPSDNSLSDFSGAVIENCATGERLMGAIKIDECSSHWRNQRTLGNPEFADVIAHIVWERDMQLISPSQNFLTIEFSIDREFEDFCRAIPSCCTEHFAQLTSIERTQIIDSLLDARIKRKVDEILSPILAEQYAWEELYYIMFFRAVGMPAYLKTQCAELARAMPRNFFELHFSRPDYIIAVLLGVSGLLPQNDGTLDKYTLELVKMFKKYTDEGHISTLSIRWGTAKSSPHSTPVLTIVRIVTLLCSNNNLFAELLNCETIEELRKMLTVSLPTYWHNHCSPLKGLRGTKGKVTVSKVDVIITNFVIPMLFALAISRDEKSYAQRAMRFYEELPAENFSLVNKWKSAQWKPRSTYDTQALVQLNDVYCKSASCAECPIAARTIRNFWKHFREGAPREE